MTTAQTADYIEHRAWENLRTLQRLAKPGESCLYWAEGHEYAPLGREGLSNGHWLLVSTPDTQRVFDKLKAKLVQHGVPPHYDNDAKSFAIHRRFVDANRALDTGVMDEGYTPIDIASLTAGSYVFRGSKRESVIYYVSAFNEAGVEVGFDPDYLLPLLGCGYTVLTRAALLPARLERDGEFAGVLMPKHTK